MNSKKAALILFVILIIASFFRLNQLASAPPGLFSDEAVNGNNTLEIIETGDYKVFYPENNGREGLFMNIQSFFVRAFGAEPWALRLPSALFGILTVLGIYFLGKELFSKEIGLASSFLLATNFWHINFSRIGFRAITSPFFLIWGLYFLIHALKNSGQKLRSSLLFAVIGGITYGLGFYSYIAYRITPVLVLGIILYFLYKKAKDRKSVLLVSAIFLVSTFITALPLGLYFLENPQDFMGRTTQISVFDSDNVIGGLTMNTLKTLGMFNIVGDWNWRHNYAGRAELFWPVGILFIIGLIASLVAIFKRKELLSNLTVILLFGLAFAPVIISNEGLPHALRAIMMIPAVFLLCGIGFSFLYERSKKYFHLPWRNTIVYAFAILIILNAYVSYFVLWANKPEVRSAFNYDFTELAYRLNEISPDIPKYVVLEPSEEMGMNTIMFITKTYLPQQQKEKNVFYIFSKDENLIPGGALKFRVN